MKKASLLFLIILPLLSMGQTPDEKPRIFRNTLYVNFLSPFARTTNISYERFLNSRYSARLGYISGSILPEGTANRSTNFFKFNGGLLEFRRYGRVYPGKTTEDFYFGPYLQYFTDELSDFEYDKKEGFVRNSAGQLLLQNSTFNVVKAGGLVGTRQVFFRRLAIDLNAGIHYQVASKNIYSSNEIINLMGRQGLSFKFGFNAGFCF
jgi:hypothetical protein